MVDRVQVQHCRHPINCKLVTRPLDFQPMFAFVAHFFVADLKACLLDGRDMDKYVLPPLSG